MSDYFYLAHPLLARTDVRNKELSFEEKTGIDLKNPFYDSDEAEVIKLLDSGKMTVEEYSEHLNNKSMGEKFVRKDLRNIDKSVAVIAVIYKGVPTIGTSMECWHAFVTQKSVIFVSNHPAHIWLQYVAKHSGGFIVETFGELAEKLPQWIKEHEEK